MYKFFHSRSKKIGLAPGTLVHIGEQKTERTLIQLMEYDDKDYYLGQQTDDLAQLTAAIETPNNTWINVIGLHQVEMIAHIGQAFGIHPLLLEDILNTHQRPKIEQYDEYIYIILKMLYWDENHSRVDAEQLSIVLSRTFVLTFQEREKDVFNPLRQRIHEGKGHLRKAGVDYLAYALLDSVIDHYFLILEQLGDELEALEEELTTSPTADTLQTIHTLKRELLYLRKSVWPLREIFSELQRGDIGLFQPTTLIYLRDVYEHTIQIIDGLETFRDVVASMLDIYLSSVSLKMNETMRVLTVIATLFIPLTFITSLYGMNFHSMPELQWRWGYPLIWIVMLLTGMVMLIYFKRRNWL